MLYAEWHRPRGVGLAGAVHRTWAVAEQNDWQFSNPRIDTAGELCHDILQIKESSSELNSDVKRYRKCCGIEPVEVFSHNYISAYIQQLLKITSVS